MDIQNKHRVELLNSKCDVVNKLYSVCKKAEYGDIDVSCCLKEMYAKTKLIDRLDCYCFPNIYNGTDTITEGSSYINYSKDDEAIGTSYLYSGSNIVSVYVHNPLYAPPSRKTVLEALLTSAGIDFVTITGEVSFWNTTVTTNCIFNNLSASFNSGTSISFEVNTYPVCDIITINCYNCIEDSDLPKMYEVLKKLGK